MIDHCVDVAHKKSLFCVVCASEEKDFARLFLAYLLREVRGTKSPIKARHVSVSLLEARMFSTGDG